MCEKEANSLPLEWSEYREFGSNFIKASTHPESISSQLDKAYKMTPAQRKDMGGKARQWVIDNFSVNVIGKKLEEFIDSAPKIKPKDFPVMEKCDPDADIPAVKDDSEWIKLMYSLILKTEVDNDDDGLKYWLGELKKGVPPSMIEKYFRSVALKDNVKKEEDKFKNLTDKDDKDRRILFVIPDDPIDIFSCTSLFRSIKESYPNFNLYVSTRKEFYPILHGNEFVHKLIEYDEYHNNVREIEEEGYFNVVYTPQLNNLNFHHFNRDVTNYCVA